MYLTSASLSVISLLESSAGSAALGRLLQAKQQHKTTTRAKKPRIEPSRAPSCPEVRPELGGWVDRVVATGAGGGGGGCVGADDDAAVGSPRVTSAVRVVLARVIIWVTTRP